MMTTRRMLRTWTAALLLAGAVAPALAAAETADADAQRSEFEHKLAALSWVKGPTSVPVGGNAQLQVPADYVFLDGANTQKFNELNENIGDGKEVMIAPADLHWSAYLEFDDGGYVKDDEKIDGAALLKSLQEGTEDGNKERERRGWQPLHVTGWAAAPAYNKATQRLEWATAIESGGQQGVNFFTKILGRRGHTSVVMVSSTQGLQASEASLDKVLEGYTFNSGETYAEWKPGDKVAEYGLAALILGGAAAVATKKGLWGVLAGFLAAAWKAVAAAAVGVVAWLRARFAKKPDAGS